MALFSVPTLRTIFDRTKADLARLPGADTRLPVSILSVIAFMVAQVTNGLYAYLKWIADQILPDTAAEEYLLRHASLKNFARNAAAPATGSVTFTGTAGTAPIGTLLQRTGGVQYVTTQTATLSGGTASVNVVAVEAGAAGNLVGGALQLVSPVAGFDSTATLVDELSGGADLEDIEDFRARYIKRLRRPIQGGATGDYEDWALEVPGVTRAWVSENWNGAGTILVQFVRDNDASIFPDSSEVAAVDTYLRGPGKKPLGCVLTVSSPTATPVSYSIAVTPNTADVKAAVTAELDDLHLRKGAPGASLLRDKDIEAAIANATGLIDFTLSVPAADVVASAGSILTRGGITWL